MKPSVTITELARQNRKNATYQEKLIWTWVRNRKIHGRKVRRQKPFIYGNDSQGHLTFYIVDFYCDELKLIIEVDGAGHLHQLAYDANRDQFFLQQGIRTVRIRNEEFQDQEMVKKKIYTLLK